MVGVFKVNPAHAPQVVFMYGACGLYAHADHNAAINLPVQAGLPHGEGCSRQEHQRPVNWIPTALSCINGVNSF